MTRMTRILALPARALPETRRSGRAGLWLLLILAGLGAVLYLQTMGGSGAGGTAGAGAAGLSESEPSPGQDASAGASAVEREPSTGGARGEFRGTPQEAPRTWTRAAPGTGRIRGELQVHGNAELGPWTLHLVPSLGMRGIEGATRRTLKFDAGVLKFELSDLPLAAFDLIPEAEGFNGRRVPVLLSPTRGEVAVVLGLFEAGSLGGRVVDTQRQPLTGLLIVLVPAMGTRRLELQTDALGGFLFPSVPDGDWTLHFGSEQLGVADPVPLTMEAPGRTLPTFEVPRMGRAEVLVRDARGNPLPDIRVRGFGPTGGLIDGRTDGEGRLWAHFLPLGRYTVRAAMPDVGRGITEFELEDLDAEAPIVRLELRP